jgi:hypothetical protein
MKADPFQPTATHSPSRPLQADERLDQQAASWCAP